MKSGRITAFSFAYAVIAEHKRDDGVNVLDELDVLDVTITPNPANRNARLVSVKTAPDPQPATEVEQLDRSSDLGSRMTAGSCSSHPRRLVASVSRSDTAETPVILASRAGYESAWTPLAPPPRAELLHVLMLPDFDRVGPP
jgi:hypothetical protein